MKTLQQQETEAILAMAKTIEELKAIIEQKNKEIIALQDLLANK